MDNIPNTSLSTSTTNDEHNQQSVEARFIAPSNAPPISPIEQPTIPYTTILEQMPDACIVLDTQWRILYYNSQAALYLPKPKTALLGHNIWDMFPKIYSSPLFSWCEQVKTSGQAIYFEYLAPVVMIWFQVHIAPIEGGICMYFRDVTERKQLEQEVARAKEQLEADLITQKEMELRKDHFISMASHELKTPLTVLSAFTQLLQEQFTAEDRPDVLQLLTKLDDQLTHLSKLVVDMLDLSKIQSNQFVLHPKQVDIDALIHEVVENLQPTTRHHLLIKGAARRPILGDKDRLAQVLTILLRNAIKYSPHADSVIIKIVTTHKMLTVRVQDFGIGIAQSHQQKLFERFYRVLNKKDQTYPGLGIGLYLAHEIIQHHGGTMNVESIEGKGSTFFFSLPLPNSRLP